jgi:dTDP-4-dehydrorhamnose reductase
MSFRLVITGANGQVGWHLQRTLAPLGEVTALTRDDLDLADLDAVGQAVRELTPDVLVNAAAYTAVDKAESEPELARTVNATAPARMARELARSGGLLIQYSTDYVFDGEKTGPYQEDDATGPLNTYGQTKLEGEQLIGASGCAHVILRTTWVYDIRGKNFLQAVLRLAGEREELRMVGDQHGAPTWARTIAEATAVIIARINNNEGKEARRNQNESRSWSSDLTGVFHLSGGGHTTWAGFAEAILEEYKACCGGADSAAHPGSSLKAKRVAPIRSAEYPTPARRPRNSVLLNDKVQTLFGVTMPDWRSQLRLAIEDMVR